ATSGAMRRDMARVYHALRAAGHAGRHLGTAPDPGLIPPGGFLDDPRLRCLLGPRNRVNAAGKKCARSRRSRFTGLARGGLYTRDPTVRNGADSDFGGS